MLCHEFALAVVGDGRLDGVGLAVIGDAIVGVARDLAQRVGMLAGLVVGDLAHRDLAVGGVGTGGDHVVALDELEGELAGLEVAAVQGLGRLDLVGDAGVLGRQVVGILELGGLVVLQLMLHAEGAVAVVHDLSHDSEFSSTVGNAVLGGAGLGLAQRVGVLASRVIGDGIHHDLAAGIVGAGGDHVVALDELEAELAGLEVTAVQGLGRGDLVGDAGVLGARLVGVGELRLVDVLQDMLSLERAVTVVGDGGLDGVLGGAVGDAAGAALDLAQRVGVLAGLVVLHGVHRDLAVGGVLAGGDDLGVLALALDELEGELAGRKVAAAQGLGHVNLVGNAGLNRFRSVNVLELVFVCFAPGHLHGSAELTLLVGRYRHGDFRNILTVGDAVNRGPGVLFADLVDIRARCLVFDRAEVNGLLALIRIVIGHGHSHGLSRGLGHRGVVLGRQLKLKRVLFRPGAALEHLGQAEVGLGVHRRRRHVVLIADLAVVAQVRINLRCALLG